MIKIILENLFRIGGIAPLIMHFYFHMHSTPSNHALIFYFSCILTYIGIWLISANSIDIRRYFDLSHFLRKYFKYISKTNIPEWTREAFDEALQLKESINRYGGKDPYYIIQVDNDRASKIYISPQGFHLGSLTSVIAIPSTINLESTIGKFKVLHEIGHLNRYTLNPVRMKWEYLLAHIYSVTMIVLFGLYNVKFLLLIYLPLIIAILLYFILSNAYTEINADSFAIKYLVSISDDIEINKIEKMFKSKVHFSIFNLTNWYLSIARKYYLSQSFKYYSSRKGKNSKKTYQGFYSGFIDFYSTIIYCFFPFMGNLTPNKSTCLNIIVCGFVVSILAYAFSIYFSTISTHKHLLKKYNFQI